jgi:hypothetical protein
MVFIKMIFKNSISVHLFSLRRSLDVGLYKNTAWLAVQNRSSLTLFVNVSGAQESISRNRFRQAGNQFLGTLKGLQIRAQMSHDLATPPIAPATSIGIGEHTVYLLHREKID